MPKAAVDATQDTHLATRRLKSEIKELVSYVEDHGWRVEDRRSGGYLRAKCPCGKHMKSIPFTPSRSSTPLNLRKWFERQTCWKEQA